METGKIYKVELTKLRKLEHAGFWPINDGASQIDFPCTLEKLNGRATIELNQKVVKKVMKLLKLEISGQPLPIGGGVHKIEI